MKAAVRIARLIGRPPAPEGASPGGASGMRRLLGGLSLLALIAACSARIATAQPDPNTPAGALALLKWCWENRDATRYHELFTENFQYLFAPGDLSGTPYTVAPWIRNDELVSATNLFGASTTRAPASSVNVAFLDGPTFQPTLWGIGYPWHQRFVAVWTLDATCTDGSTLSAGGQSVWTLVRGDSAVIPQDLKDRGFLPDSNRWYIERWAELVNTPPVVKAPTPVTGRISAPITVQVTAQDPDGEPITSLSAQSGLNASFSPTADNSAGTFYWIPTQADVGAHSVTFTAANSLSGSATTTINVVGLVASLVVSPSAGNEPLNVTADASGSSDPGGQIVSCQFDFGDGTVVGPQSSPIAYHTYKAGAWKATVRVVDASGVTASASATVAVTVSRVASLVLSPSSGFAPLTVTADASGSTPGVATYRFDFGDGTVVGPQSSPTATHTYAVGTWKATVLVTYSGGATATASATVTVTMPDLSLLPNLVLNPSFEVDTKGWGPWESTIERVTGGYDGLYALQMTGTTSIVWGFGVNDSPDWIHPTTAAGKRYRFSAWVRSEANHGLARIRVREYLLATKALLGQISSFGVTLSPAWQTLVVDYTTLSAGSSLDLQVKENPLVPNEVFLTDNISIRDITGITGRAPAQGEIESEPDAPPSLQPTMWPSPVKAQGVLAFATSRPGGLRVDLLDLAGRQVRRLDDETDSPAGMHVLTIDGTRDDGQRMRPGVYFYRIVADEGRVTGRFVMLR